MSLPRIMEISEMKEELPHFYHNAKPIALVQDFLHKKYGGSFKAYSIYTGWHMLAFREMTGKNENFEIIATLSDGVADFDVNKKDKDTIDILPDMNNCLIYSRQFGVAFADMPVFRADGTATMRFLYAKTREEAMAYLRYADEKSRELKDKEVIVYTDTPNGLRGETKSVTHMISRDEIVMDEKLKKQIFSSIDAFFKESDGFYKKYNIPHKRGVLLYGSPGNGKTTLVKSLVGSLDCPVVYWQVTEFTTSASIEQVFKQAHSMSPVVLVIEDIDSIPQGTRSAFLNTLDGATSYEGIFLIGTTNYPERIDPALMNRAGRFDQSYELKRPDEELRLLYINRRGFSDFLSEGEIQVAASETEGLSFVQLNELFVMIALQHYTEGVVNLGEALETMQANIKKAKKNDWTSEKNSSPVGFATT